MLPFRRGLFHSILRGRLLLQTAGVAYSLDRLDEQTSIAQHICYWGEVNFGRTCFAVSACEGSKRIGDLEKRS